MCAVSVYKPNYPVRMRWPHKENITSTVAALNSSANSAAFNLVYYFHNHYDYDNHHYDHNCAFHYADYSGACGS